MGITRMSHASYMCRFTDIAVSEIGLQSVNIRETGQRLLIQVVNE